MMTSSLRRFVFGLLFLAGLGSLHPALAQSHDIKEVPMTVVTVPLPAGGQQPGGVEQKLVKITDSGKLPIQSHNLSTQSQLLDLGGLNQKLQVNPTLGYGQAMDTDYRYAGKTGAPVCGGFWQGRLQPKCPPEPAIFVAEAVGACPAGSFLDAGSGSCWSCPDGYNRTADPITGSTACSKADASVPLKRMAGAKAGNLCPSGSFFDPIRGGECYSCPSGYKRSAAHIDAPNACFVPAGENLTKATRHRKTAWPHDCGGGQFHDTWDGGGCWSCPRGYNRTGNHINSDRACSSFVPELHARATPRGAAQCKAGEFHDPRNGGECWTCPTGTYRTVFPVDGREACEQRAGVRLSKAVRVSAFSCPAGSFLDLISSRDANVRARIEKQIAASGTRVQYGTSIGGTCWTCPPGYDRDLSHVASDSACTTRSIKWQPAPYIQPGLLGLAGSREVALALLNHRALIEELIAALAIDTGTPLAQMRQEVYAEIAMAPQSSAILAAAMYKRIEAAVLAPAQATADEKRLVASLAEAIRQYRIFVAQNALDAYDQWVEARSRHLANDAQKAGAGSLEQQRQNLVAFKGGEIPPDFTEIVGELVVFNVMAPAAMQSFLTASTASPQLRNAIFPNRRAREVLQQTRDNIKATNASSKALKEGGEESVEQLIKSSTKVKGKAGQALSKATGKIFKQAMKMGPQILADVAVEMIVGTIEHFEAVLNARPKLVTALATAKNPVDMLRELRADEDWLHREWSVALGNGDQGPMPLGEFAAAAKVAMAQAAPSAQPAQPSAAAWQKMPGLASDIGIGGPGDGVLWHVGTNPVPGGYGVWRWDGKAWQPTNGGALRIDVDGEGNAHVVNDKGEIFRWRNGGWEKLPGLARDIGVGANGALWHIGANAVPGGHGIWRWTGSAWTAVPGGAVRIDVDPQGNPWVVNDRGDIFRWNGSAFVGVPGKARDIGIGADGSVFVAGPDGTIHKWNGNAWVKRDGLLNEITVSPRGIPFGVNGAREIWMGYP